MLVMKFMFNEKSRVILLFEKCGNEMCWGVLEWKRIGEGEVNLIFKFSKFMLRGVLVNISLYMFFNWMLKSCIF